MAPRSRLSLVLAAGLVAPALLAQLPGRQVPGYAEITSPVGGQVVSGLVTLTGTADHPGFSHYTLAFSYAGTDPDLWFDIGEAIQSPVTDDRLGVWDTTHITEGAYDLRLEVWPEDGEPLVAVARGVIVAERPAAATPTLGAVTVTPAPMATEPSSSTQAPDAATGEASVRAATPIAPSTAALAAGGLASAAAIVLAGGYSWLRGRRRSDWMAPPGSRRRQRRRERRGARTAP